MRQRQKLEIVSRVRFAYWPYRSFRFGIANMETVSPGAASNRHLQEFRMKNFLAALSLAASLVASAAVHAQGSGLMQPAVALGTIQSVDLVQMERDIHAFDERAMELRMQPDLTERLIIRLDAGDIVIVTVKGAQRFRVGERVRVVSQTYSPYGPRVEHE